MPTLADPDYPNLYRGLHVGESGTGKSGALASLALAGYNLHILDYDAGLISRNALFEALQHDKAALARVRYESPRDTVVAVNGVPKIKSPVHAYKDAGRILNEWNVNSFTSNDILILDTLTTFSDAGFNEACALGGRLNQRPQLQDYGWMADSVKLFLDMITSPDLKCHVIVNTHVRYLNGEGDVEIMRGLPNAKGQEISRTVSRYFNTVLLFRTQGTGPAAKRIISTQPQGVVEVKAPLTAKKDYPISTGLADFFFDVLGTVPSTGARPTAPSTLAHTPTA